MDILRELDKAGANCGNCLFMRYKHRTATYHCKNKYSPLSTSGNNRLGWSHYDLVRSLILLPMDWKAILINCKYYEDMRFNERISDTGREHLHQVLKPRTKIVVGL